MANHVRRGCRKRFKKALGELGRAAMFRNLKRQDLENLASAAMLAEFETGEKSSVLATYPTSSMPWDCPAASPLEGELSPFQAALSQSESSDRIDSLV